MGALLSQLQEQQQAPVSMQQQPGSNGQGPISIGVANQFAQGFNNSSAQQMASIMQLLQQLGLSAGKDLKKK